MSLEVQVLISLCLGLEFMSQYVVSFSVGRDLPELLMMSCIDRLTALQPRSGFWYPPGSSNSKDPVDGNSYKLLDINVTHPIRTTQLAISHFLEKKKPGNILHTSSIVGQVSVPYTPLVSVHVCIDA